MFMSTNLVNYNNIFYVDMKLYSVVLGNMKGLFLSIEII